MVHSPSATNTQGDAVIASGILELCQTVVHLEDRGLKDLLEPQGLLALAPVGEVRMLGDAVLDDQVLYAPLLAAQPTRARFRRSRDRR
jgi:hypothetical protein